MHVCTYVYIYVYMYVNLILSRTEKAHWYWSTHTHTHVLVCACVFYIYIHTHAARIRKYVERLQTEESQWARSQQVAFKIRRNWLSTSYFQLSITFFFLSSNTFFFYGKKEYEKKEKTLPNQAFIFNLIRSIHWEIKHVLAEFVRLFFFFQNYIQTTRYN